MKLIQHKNRHELAHEFQDYIASTLHIRKDRMGDFLSLFNDPEAVDVILDDQRLFDRLAVQREHTTADHLYYFVIVRHSLQQVGIEDREVAEYLAAMLADYAHAPKVNRSVAEDAAETVYLVDLLRAMQRSSPQGRFFIRSHIANYALYITGLFPERLRYKSRRRSVPDFQYYVELGRSTYRTASEDQLAWEFQLDGVFSKLADDFHRARLALSRIAEHGLYDGEPFVNHSAVLSDVV